MICYSNTPSTRDLQKASALFLYFNIVKVWKPFEKPSYKVLESVCPYKEQI